MHQMQPVNRIAGYFKAMAETKTATKERSPKAEAISNRLASNLAYEMRRVGIDPEAENAAEVLCEKIAKIVGNAPSDQTIRRYIKGDISQPKNEILESIAAFFQYAPARSILDPDHIQRREKIKPKADNAPAARTDIAEGLTKMLNPLAHAIHANKSDAQEVFDQLMSRPDSSTLTAFVNCWIRDQYQQKR